MIACVVGATMVVTGCNSDGGSSTPDTRPATTTTTREKVEGVVVDLMLTGDRTATLKGTKGTCDIPRFGAASYQLSGADYPELGPDGMVSIKGPVTVANGGRIPSSARVTVNEVGFVSDAEGTGITLSRDDTLATLDLPLRGGPGGAEDINLDDPANTLSARLSGTIRCTS